MNNKSKFIEDLALKIKLERIKRNLSQEKLGELANISRLTIGYIERGESEPSIVKVSQIADALNMKLCDLVKFDDI